MKALIFIIALLIPSGLLIAILPPATAMAAGKRDRFEQIVAKAEKEHSTMNAPCSDTRVVGSSCRFEALCYIAENYQMNHLPPREVMKIVAVSPRIRHEHHLILAQCRAGAE
jgi:hypothetical protein